MYSKGTRTKTVSVLPETVVKINFLANHLKIPKCQAIDSAVEFFIKQHKIEFQLNNKGE